MATVKDKSQRDFRLTNTESQNTSLSFNKISVGNKVLRDDVTLITDYWAKVNERKARRGDIERALEMHDVKGLRRLSEYFFNTSGIYSRLCRYMAYLYRYDYFITPIVYDSKLKDEKIIEGWFKSAAYLDRCNLKKVFGEIALEVIKHGCYYAYIQPQKTGAFLQQLPANYCRSRYRLNGQDVIEFQLQYFDDTFKDATYKMRVLKMFPKEIQKAYLAYKRGTLDVDYKGDEKGWFLLDPASTIKFNLSNSDTPLFVSVIPSIMDLDDAKDLDKKKMEQQLLRIIIQKMPIDKNGDLIFDVDEAQALHTNAVNMLGKAIGVNVLTTFADVDVADMSDKGNVSSVDQLDKVERTVYNEAGVSQMQFNSSSNLALQRSIDNDTATMTDLLLQFENFAENLLSPFNKNPKRLYYSVSMLPTTIYNYQDLSKLYKEQTMLGFSKLLPQVALGQSQVNVMMTAYFENELLELDQLFVAPQMSSTMSSSSSNSEEEKGEPSAGDQGGRPELSEDEKSDKTIANEEAQQ